MKTIKSILLSAILLSNILSFGQKNEIPWLKKCTGLTYHVNYNAVEYDFIIDSLVVKNDIAFKWKMTEPLITAGKVKISKPALDTATGFNNFFSDNSNLDLTDKTTVWVSKKIYKAIKKGASVSIDAGSGREKLTFINNEKITAKFNGSNKTFNVLYATTPSGNKFWILDDPANPIILKMYLGWTIEIKEILTNKKD